MSTEPALKTMCDNVHPNPRHHCEHEPDETSTVSWNVANAN